MVITSALLLLLQLAVVCKAYHTELEQSLWAIRSGLRLFRTDSAAAIAALQAAGLLGRTEQHVADFLYTSKGRIPARFVGQYLTKAYADADATREEKARNKRLLVLYLRRFDFDSDTPVQALRRLLTRTRMPRESRRCVFGSLVWWHQTHRVFAGCDCDSLSAP
jgi:hypothetical protein